MAESPESMSHNDLYEKVGRIEGIVISLDKKLSEFIDASNEQRKSFEQSDKSLEARIRKLENDKYLVQGAFAVVSGIFGFMASWLRDWFMK